ncbi:MAG: hypothetical protein D6753_02605 [Planctomycetota bacterium]|nr:MAG: hypothetical protein D6753_02605 [Planctomycetota bacterium]
MEGPGSAPESAGPDELTQYPAKLFERSDPGQLGVFLCASTILACGLLHASVCGKESQKGARTETRAWTFPRSPRVSGTF